MYNMLKALFKFFVKSLSFFSHFFRLFHKSKRWNYSNLHLSFSKWVKVTAEERLKEEENTEKNTVQNLRDEIQVAKFSKF